VWTVSGAGNATVFATATAEKTITNTYKPGTIKVTKNVVMSGLPALDPAPTFQICLTGGPTTVACQAIGDGATATFGPLLPGSYSVSENGVNTTVWTVTGTGSVTVANGETEEVTVTNTYKQAPLTVTKTA